MKIFWQRNGPSISALVCTISLITFFISGVSLKAKAGEWRTGDIVQITAFCQIIDPIMKVLHSDNFDHAAYIWRNALVERECLLGDVGGKLRDKMARTDTVFGHLELWEILFQENGQVFYTLLPGKDGSHKIQKNNAKNVALPKTSRLLQVGYDEKIMEKNR